jgi:hypothetical protein
VGEGTCSLILHLDSILSVHACHPAGPYLPTEFAGCSVGPGISRGARKLAQTPRVIKKKKKEAQMKLLFACPSGLQSINSKFTVKVHH